MNHTKAVNVSGENSQIVKENIFHIYNKFIIEGKKNHRGGKIIEGSLTAGFVFFEKGTISLKKLIQKIYNNTNNFSGGNL